MIVQLYWLVWGGILVLALIPLVIIFQGWVLTVLWSWFVAPTFNLPELSIAVAIGLSLVVSMFKTYTASNKELTQNEKLTNALATVLVPLFTLFFGWIVHLFM
jgi:hypothetical protein